MKQYPWAVNPAKLQRAIAGAKHKTDEEIKELYIKIGGLTNPEIEITEIMEAPVIDVSSHTVSEDIVAEAEITSEVTGTEMPTEIEITATEKPKRKKKNA